MKRLLTCVAGAVVLLASSAALACGAPFGTGVEVDPHQDIIVVWKDNVETYVFQPIFCGTATDFGLLLPVPALLTQSPALSDQQAFTKVAALSEPEKVQVTQHNSIGCAAGGIESKSGTIDNGTSVVASGRVGFLEWKQLKAETVASFTDWLTANGYPYTSAASSVFSYYVGKSWYFLAFRISQQAVPSGGTICQALGPVAFSFPTTVPVVPSAMAGAGATMGSAQRFSWRIFGITRGDAQLGFSEGSYGDHVLWYSGAIAAADVPALAGLGEAGDRLTRLTLGFYAGSTADVDLGLSTPQDFRGKEYVTVYDDSACSVATGVRSSHGCVLVLFGLALPGLICWRRWRGTRPST